MTAEGNVVIDFKGMLSAGFKNALGQIKREFKKIGELKNAAFGFGRTLARSATVAAGALGGLALHARDFNLAMAEVSTLVDTSTTDMEGLNKQILELSVALGKSPTELAKGLYQTISAGASDAAQAMEILEGATKAAIGGVASVPQAVDLLTNTMNAYKNEALSVAQISDVAFSSVKLGKTTFGELAESMGEVIPIASSLNIRFEDVFSSVAAITTIGQKTDKAVTQIKAAMVAMIKPTEKMNELFKDFGGVVPAVSNRAFGFKGVLDRLKEATGGNAAELKKYANNVRALAGLVTLTGPAAAKFAEILDKNRDAAGSASEAFDKMAESAGFKANQALNAISVVATELGNEILIELGNAIDELGGPAAVVDKVKQKFMDLKPTMVESFNAVKDALPSWNLLSETINLVWAGAKNLVGTAVDLGVTMFNLGKVFIPAAIESFNTLITRFEVLLFKLVGPLVKDLAEVAAFFGIISEGSALRFGQEVDRRADSGRVEEQNTLAQQRRTQFTETFKEAAFRFGERGRARNEEVREAFGAVGRGDRTAQAAALRDAASEAAAAAVAEDAEESGRIIKEKFKEAIAQGNVTRNNALRLAGR